MLSSQSVAQTGSTLLEWTGSCWFLWKYPHRRVIPGSYSADLADEYGAWIRDAISTWGDDLGTQLNASSKARNRFDLAGHESGLFATGVGGGLDGPAARWGAYQTPRAGAGLFLTRRTTPWDAVAPSGARSRSPSRC